MNLATPQTPVHASAEPVSSRRTSRGAPGAQGPPLSPWWAWWGVVTLWWTVSGLISAAQVQSVRAAMGEQSAWSDALRLTLASSYLWVPLTILALWSASRFPIERTRLVLPLAIHVGAGFVVSMLRMGAVVAFNPWIGWYREIPALPQLFVTSLNNNLLIYWLLVGAGHAVHYARAARLQQELLNEARLLVLKSQLQPHFLFNTLNTISAFVRADPATAERMIDRLGRLLRHSLESGSAHEVSLREELAALEPYVDIELTRFEDRLTVRRRIEPHVLDAAVPHFLLQPLVENAVRHGIAPRSMPGTIEIAAWREGEDLVIQVEDDGVGVRGDADTGRGLGLRNTRDRLHHLYGARHALTLSAAPGGGARTVVRVPFRPAGEP
jgi:two-component system, LytTR family, sensor kinase